MKGKSQSPCPIDIENSYDKNLPGKLSEMSEAERAFMRAGAKGLSSTDASRWAEGVDIDQKSAWGTKDKKGTSPFVVIHFTIDA